jgi:hypothetical protein
MPYIEIHFKGSIDTELSEWFQGMSVYTSAPDECCLSGEVADNSAIYGIVSTLSSLGISLVSIVVTDNAEDETFKKIIHPHHRKEF